MPRLCVRTHHRLPILHWYQQPGTPRLTKKEIFHIHVETVSVICRCWFDSDWQYSRDGLWALKLLQEVWAGRGVITVDMKGVGQRNCRNDAHQGIGRNFVWAAPEFGDGRGIDGPGLGRGSSRRLRRSGGPPVRYRIPYCGNWLDLKQLRKINRILSNARHTWPLISHIHYQGGTSRVKMSHGYYSLLGVFPPDFRLFFCPSQEFLPWTRPGQPISYTHTHTHTHTGSSSPQTRSPALPDSDSATAALMNPPSLLCSVRSLPAPRRLVRSGLQASAATAAAAPLSLNSVKRLVSFPLRLLPRQPLADPAPMIFGRWRFPNLLFSSIACLLSPTLNLKRCFELHNNTEAINKMLYSEGDSTWLLSIGPDNRPSPSLGMGHNIIGHRPQLHAFSPSRRDRVVFFYFRLSILVANTYSIGQMFSCTCNFLDFVFSRLAFSPFLRSGNIAFSQSFPRFELKVNIYAKLVNRRGFYYFCLEYSLRNP